MTDTLRAAAQAVVDRWDTPLWKDVPATAEYIGRLRASLEIPENGTNTAEREALQVYRCKIKSRKQIDKEIPREQQGWWADVAAGQKLLLRQAVQSDIDRCTLGGKRSRNPDDYMCETQTNGSLVSKIALEYMNPEENVFAAAPPLPASAKELI